MIPKLIAKFTNSLALGVETSSTEMLLSSTVSRDNQTIPSGTYGFVINRGQENEEFCIGSYVAGTVTFTARGLSYLDGITEITANKKKHRKGDPVEMTTHPALTYIAKMLSGDIDLDGILKYPASRLINQQRQLVDKEYADNIVSSQITSLKVSADGALTVAVNSGYYSLNGVITYYAGSVGNALADDAVNYIQMNDGVLNINSVGFTEGAMPLAKITTASGSIMINEDARAVLGWLDVKTNSGIGRDSSGLFIDLATNPGLKFVSGKLSAKVKENGGLLLDSEGLSLASTDIVMTCQAAEDIVVSSYPKQVFLGDSSLGQYNHRNYSAERATYDNNINIYTTNQALLTFRTGLYMTRLASVSVGYCKYGSPTGTFTVNLYLADANRKPTGPSLGSVSMNVSDLQSRATSTPLQLLTFSSPISVQKNTEYCLVASAPSASGTSNCASLLTNASGGEGYYRAESTDAGSTWSTPTLSYAHLKITGYSDQVDGKLYQTDNTEESRMRCLSLLTSSVLSGAYATIKLNGKISNFTNLSIGSKYYVNNIQTEISNATENNTTSLGFDSSSLYRGQTVTIGENTRVVSFKAKITKSGTPTDRLRCDIYDSIGGTLVASSNEVQASDIGSTLGLVEFFFDNAIVSKNTQYYFELVRTGALSTANFYSVAYNTSSVYSGGAFVENRSAISTAELVFYVKCDFENNITQLENGRFIGTAVSKTEILMGDLRGLINIKSESGSYSLGTTTKDVQSPLSATSAVILITFTTGAGGSIGGELRVRKGSSSFLKWYNTDVISASWSANTLTISTPNASGCSWTATISYYN